MKYCTSCGNQLSDEDKFCTRCGAQQSNAVAVEPEVQQQSNAVAVEPEVQQGSAAVAAEMQQQSYAQPDQRYIYQQPAAASAKFAPKAAAILVGIVVVALGVIYLLFRVFSGGSSSIDSAVEEYYEAILDKDGDAFLDATCTHSMVRALEETTGYDKDRIAEELESAMSYQYEDYSKIKDIKVEEQDKMTKAELTEGLEEIKDETGVTVKISEMRQVEVTFKYYDTYFEEWDEDTETLTVYKSGSKWYVLPSSL